MHNARAFFLILSTVLLTPPAASAASDESILWSYDGDADGQDMWPTLSEDYALCGSGTQQSPIDIGRTIAISKDAALRIFYAPAQAQFFFSRHSPMISLRDNNSIVDNGQSYRLVQIEFHSPGEHTVLGGFSLAEIEFVHLNFQGQPLILSVLVNVGGAIPDLDTVLALTPGTPGNRVASEFNPAALLPAKRGYYAYTGSLTSPPCTEGVQWRIMKQPITVSQAQMESLARLTKRNARATQPVYIREIMESP